MTALLRCEGLTRRFGGLTAVNDVSLDFALGEVHAVIGPSTTSSTGLSRTGRVIMPA